VQKVSRISACRREPNSHESAFAAEPDITVATRLAPATQRRTCVLQACIVPPMIWNRARLFAFPIAVANRRNFVASAGLPYKTAATRPSRPTVQFAPAMLAAIAGATRSAPPGRRSAAAAAASGSRSGVLHAPAAEPPISEALSFSCVRPRSGSAGRPHEVNSNSPASAKA
jgi:hypothetical protein